MSNRSMTDRIAVLPHLNGSFSSTQTPASGVDIASLHTAEVVVDIGAAASLGASPADGSWTAALQHSDEADANFSAVEDGDVVIPDGQEALVSGGIFAIVDNDTEDAAVYRVGYVGSKRYLRTVLTATNTPGATPICVHIVGDKKLAA